MAESELGTTQKVRLTHTGFQDFNAVNSYPITVAADTWTTVVNDGAGAFSQDTYGPYDPGDGGQKLGPLIDVTTGSIDPTQLRLGQKILVRSDLRFTPTVNNTYVQFRYELGTGAGTYYLTTQVGLLSAGAGIEYPVQTTNYIYMGDTNTRNNPITLQVFCSNETTFTNLGSVIEVLE